ncbi:uncharacterized protein VTP21DRAFT_7556 [Calcarisporiella thermophila]|uniref:uncharacterized protein n=1 Tax=Calcarisporiella thermophila TaxID=911321 RepID=UPI0037449CAD
MDGSNSLHDFYNQLDDKLYVTNHGMPIAASVDNLINFITVYQEAFLSSQQELVKCCYRILDSPLCEQKKAEAIKYFGLRAIESDDTNEIWILYHILLLGSREDSHVLKWTRPLGLFGKLRQQVMGMHGPRMQRLAIELMYEMCRIQRLGRTEMETIDARMIAYLLDLIEHTREDATEDLNYATTKLLLAFNEQFMVLQSCSPDSEEDNGVIDVLAQDVGRYRTFGESIVFLLNRAAREDHCLQMLILKLLYLIFNTPETCDLFYTNDLRVLVEVIVREVYDLPANAELLFHTYLRVLGPLFSNTQLQEAGDKREQVLILLEDLVCERKNYGREISPTTRRLVERARTAVIGRGRELTYSDSIYNLVEKAPSLPGLTNASDPKAIALSNPSSRHPPASTMRSAPITSLDPEDVPPTAVAPGLMGERGLANSLVM